MFLYSRHGVRSCEEADTLKDEPPMSSLSFGTADPHTPEDVVGETFDMLVPVCTLRIFSTSSPNLVVDAMRRENACRARDSGSTSPDKSFRNMMENSSRYQNPVRERRSALIL